jgi:hypothetical protein
VRVYRLPFDYQSHHPQEEYRGRGIAKAIVLKLFHDKTSDFDPEKLHHADVVTRNLQSQGVCKSLGGIQACKLGEASLFNQILHDYTQAISRFPRFKYTSTC